MTVICYNPTDKGGTKGATAPPLLKNWQKFRKEYAEDTRI